MPSALMAVAEGTAVGQAFVPVGPASVSPVMQSFQVSAPLGVARSNQAMAASSLEPT